MQDWGADVAQYTVRGVPRKQSCDALPRVMEGVHLEEVVLAAVAGQLQLGAYAIPGTRRLCLHLAVTVTVAMAMAIAIAKRFA